MSEPIGERFIEGRIVNLDKESVENLERINEEVSKKEEKLRNDLDILMSKLIGI
ncbi:MAG: hypothetical protein ACI4VN_06160 [Clostridia bacterium]|nr:hypothetical protein [Clostridia bacterium]